MGLNATYIDVTDNTDPCAVIITRTWALTDDCGNTSTQDQIITVEDVTPPTASNPTQIVIAIGPAPAPDVNVITDESDNCTPNRWLRLFQMFQTVIYVQKQLPEPTA